MKVVLKTKEGFSDTQIWNLLLSKDIDITPVRQGVTEADIPDLLLQQLEEIADIEKAEK